MKLKLPLLASLLFSQLPAQAENPGANAFYASSQDLPWKKVFQYSGTDDWTEDWFLDGLKADLRPSEKGLIFQAGHVRDDHASHAVLWTKREFQGDILVQYDYTRLDTVNWAVNILYLHAQGNGEDIFSRDIYQWREYREIPYMRHYFDNMNLLHISYAALGNDDDSSSEQYIHARRYPTGPNRTFPQTGLGERQPVGGFIIPGVTYEITAVKIGERLLFSVKPKGKDEEKRRSFIWDTSALDPVTQGRIGLRHMWTRSARYADFRVSELGE
ncbi:DUF1961 family protein [Pelagicoccus sp. NFK12]|uniref:DUF1961 family protein n=1 Tax=Pelagicoccus enzymogenes TaxID=2773457 RepID=A0A927IHD4_9BACT|nr:DUF1961 family protein [Pelagicoccus enzymogenes]MBD5780061.1 DUF1961 family protein [Pelagicoccus enzymogenes]